MANFLKEFKEFAVKGNMIDIAVGLIIGAAFNGVVDTLVKKVLMPPISLLTDDINFENKEIVLRKALSEGGTIIREKVAIEYGTMITVLVNFLIVALCVFFIVKVMNKLRTKAQNPEDKKVVTPKDIELLSDLKKLMKEQNELLRQAQNNNLKGKDLS